MFNSIAENLKKLNLTTQQELLPSIVESQVRIFLAD